METRSNKTSECFEVVSIQTRTHQQLTTATKSTMIREKNFLFWCYICSLLSDVRHQSQTSYLLMIESRKNLILLTYDTLLSVVGRLIHLDVLPD
jgi:hypothetical protein